eukprot:1968153-Rhodomonas_salina.2
MTRSHTPAETTLDLKSTVTRGLLASVHASVPPTPLQICPVMPARCPLTMTPRASRRGSPSALSPLPSHPFSSRPTR